MESNPNLDPDISEALREKEELEQYDMKELLECMEDVNTIVRKAKTKDELTVYVMDTEFTHKLLKLIRSIETVVFGITRRYVLLTPASLLVKAQDSAVVFGNISKSILNAMQFTLKVFDVNLERDFIEPMDAKDYFSENYGLDEGDFSQSMSTERVIAINNRLRKTRRDMANALGEVFEVIDRLLYYGEELYGKLDDIEEISIRCMFENSAVRFATINGPHEADTLEKGLRIVKRKRLGELSAEDWADMMTIEEEAMRLAVNGLLVNSDDERFEIYNKELRVEMQKNRQLMIMLLDTYNDHELFDFTMIACMYKDVLNAENYWLFIWLTFRANIMHIRMNPALEPRYQAWKKGEEYEEEPAVVKPKRDKSVLTSPEAMKIWKKLQRKGWIDENLMPVKGLSKPKVAMIASVITDVLHTEPRWSAIEKLWGIPNLANQLVRALNTDYYNDFMKEIEDAIK